MDPRILLFIADKIGDVGKDPAAPRSSSLPDPKELALEVLGVKKKDLYSGSILDQLQKLVSSDIKLKDPVEYIGQLVKHKKKFTPKDLKLAMEHMNDYETYDTKYAKHWKDSVLDGYAQHIKNYKYKYKEEAKQLDASIDPETQHIGPMAQDIEAVNPAAIITDPETGYKSVDTGRLALMNAGAIAEIARELKGIKQKGVVK